MEQRLPPWGIIPRRFKIYSFLKSKAIMKKKILILFACFICIQTVAQVSLGQYKVMYKTIKETLRIDSAYVSDSLRELESLGYKLYSMKLRDSIPLYNPYITPRAEYSAILQTNFESLEASQKLRPWSNVIYFSFPDESYLCADVYKCVKNMKMIDVFPIWGFYEEWYTFVFQIRGDTVILLNYSMNYEL